MQFYFSALGQIDCLTFSHYYGSVLSSSQVAKCTAPGQCRELRQALWLDFDISFLGNFWNLVCAQGASYFLVLSLVYI